ncbi:hypothetical protein LSPH26S_03839 [Lysinibacillus sphaericus]
MPWASSRSFARTSRWSRNRPVSVVGEVDQELQAALFHFDELAALVELAVLGTALAALAGLDRDAFARHAEHLAGDAGDLAQAQAGHVGRHVGRRAVLLDVQVIVAAGIAVDVDRRGVLGQVLVVGAPAVDALAGKPLAQVLDVLLQPVLQHLRAGRERLRLARLLVARLQVEGQRRGFQRAVVQRVALVRVQLVATHSTSPASTAARQPVKRWRRVSPSARYSRGISARSPRRSPYGGLVMTRP